MNKKQKMWLVGGVVVATGVGIYMYEKKKAAAAAPRALPAGSVTPVTSFTNGQKYTIAALVPAGIQDITTLTNNLVAAGWTNVSVPFFSGTTVPGMVVPAGFQTTPQSYVAQGIWGGASGTSVPAGVVAAATP